MTRINKLVARIVLAALVLAGVSFATPAAAATVAPWEPDPNSLGTLAFYDASGKVVTSGNDLSHLFDYAVASTSADRPTNKATLYFGFPNHSQSDSLNWTSSTASTPAKFPDSSAPAPLNDFGSRPVAHAASNEANLSSQLSVVTLDQEPGYQNIVQIRLRDSGPGNPVQDQFWTGDIRFNQTANTWTQVFPVQSQTTTTTLAVSPTGSQTVGQPVTLTATVAPSAAGSVQFTDGSTVLGSATVSNGTASYTTSSLAAGAHSFTATFTPDNADAYTGSTSAATSYTITSPTDTAPGAPTAVTATAGNASATVSWTAPASDGGSAITGYVVQYSSDNGTTWTSAPSTAGTATTRTVTGLTNGTAYVFRVAATNAVGTSDYSDKSAAVTPVADASALTIVAPTTVRYNTAAAISTVLTDTTTKAALGGASVSLYRRATTTGAWSLAKTVTTSSKGAASTSLTLTANAQFQWRYAATATHAAATSATKSVAVSQTITASRTPSTVKHGGTVKVYGTVAPSGSGQTVTLQRLISGKWVTQKGAATIKKQKLPNGKTTVGFVFSVKLDTKGSYTYRVAKAATSTLAAGYSSSLPIRAT